MKFADKDLARAFFSRLTQVAKDWNRVDMLESKEEFQRLEEQLQEMLAEVTDHA